MSVYFKIKTVSQTAHNKQTIVNLVFIDFNELLILKTKNKMDPQNNRKVMKAISLYFDVTEVKTVS